MEHVALARKWRPSNFQDVVGQNHAVRILTHALNSNRLHHAWLLTGTRGVGKTTIARILAKALNCETGISANPCGKCHICNQCDAGKFIDLLEIDAASRTKVEDTRELLDSIQYVPTNGRFRIYLIDEVHMLSGHSFNALLKTLEEPPPHVKFVLATTDPDKLPVTVLSRCLQIHLHHVSPEIITSRLTHICAKEEITAEPEALRLIAIAAKGSLRDALSLLDQAIAFTSTGNTLNTACIDTLIGSTDTSCLINLLNHILNQDGAALIDSLDKLKLQGPDFDKVTADLLSLLHSLSMQQTLPKPNIPKAIKNLATNLTPETVQLYYQITLNGRKDLMFAPTPACGFEMLVLRMLAFSPNNNPQNIPSKKITSANIKTQPITTNNEPRITKDANSKDNNMADWKDILKKLNLSGMTLALASNCRLSKIEDTQIELQLTKNHESLLNNNITDRLQNALNRWHGKPIKLRILTASNEIKTPASEKRARQKNLQQDAKGALMQDKGIQDIINTFDATLDPTTIKAIDTD